MTESGDVLRLRKTSSPEPPNLNRSSRWLYLVESIKSSMMLGKSQRQKMTPGRLQVVAAQRKKKEF